MQTQPAQVEEMLIDGVISSLVNMEEGDSSISSWSPVMASFRAIVSIPFQSYPFVERCMHKLMHIIMIAQSVKQNTPAAIRVGCHSLLTSILYTVQTETNLLNSKSEPMRDEECMKLQKSIRDVAENSAFLQNLIMSASQADEFVEVVESILSTASQLLPGLGQFRTKWFDLAYHVCCTESQITLATCRCYTTCAALLRQEDTMMYDLYSSALSALKINLLEEYCKIEPLQHIIQCIMRMVNVISYAQRLDLFWISIMMVQSSKMDTFPICFQLLVVVLESINAEKPEEISLLHILEKSRAEHSLVDFEKCLKKVERQFLGLSFISQDDIAISLCASLLKGAQLTSCNLFLRRFNTMFSFPGAPLGCLPLKLLSVTDCETADVDAIASCRAHLHSVFLEQPEAISDTSGFETAPNSPFPISPMNAKSISDSDFFDEETCAWSPNPSKKQLFPITPVKSVMTTKSNVNVDSKPNIIMGTPGTVREGQSRQPLADTEKSAVLFTALLCASVKGSHDVKILRHGYTLLQEMTKVPNVVKYMYRC